MSFTILYLNASGQPYAWHGTYFDSADEATRQVRELGWRLVENWDHTVEVPCLHGIHQHDCARCAVYQCVHMNVPEQCARCVALRAIDLIRCWDCGDEHMMFHRKNRDGTYSDCPACGSQITCHPHDE